MWSFQDQKCYTWITDYPNYQISIYKLKPETCERMNRKGICPCDTEVFQKEYKIMKNGRIIYTESR